MKEYFPHDYHSRNDRKLVNLRMKMGLGGIGLYWCIVEMLYENNGAIGLSEIERIAFELGTESDRITELLKGFELFQFYDEVFYSPSVNERLKKREEKSEKARESAEARWGRATQKDADAFPTHPSRNAIKEKKRKEKNKEEKEEKEERFLSGEIETMRSQFDIFRKAYPGVKRGRDIEWENFIKKEKNFQQVVRTLLPALNNEIAHKQALKRQGKFVAEWKHLSTWINAKCWTQEFAGGEVVDPDYVSYDPLFKKQ